MSGENWTPGPWTRGKYDEHLGYDCMTGGIRTGPCVLDGNDYGQGWCKEIDPSSLSRMEADAHLIAAAPDMYEALKYVESVIEMLIGDDESMQASAAPTTQRVKDALDKARGEEQDDV